MYCMKYVDPEVRFWAKVDKCGTLPDFRPDLGPCWLWTSGLKNGYGEFNTGVMGSYQYQYAHIFSYVLVRGPIPNELELDHLCLIKPCVNPFHLEAVTHAENCRRSWWATHSHKTHCVHGHVYAA